MAEKCGLEGNSAFAKGFFLGVIGVALCAKDCVEAMQYSINNLKIAKKEGITVTEETYNECAKRYADNIGFASVKTFKEIYGRDYIMGNIVLEFVCIWLYDNNTLVERIW